jgi:Formate hydrogenlyase subunit 3/Multisubunit Na+/H+ antiporter, MnhD subunit
MFNLYISLEIVVLSAIVLIDIDGENEKLLLNKFKRIIISFLGSCLILLGIALLYAQLHTLNLAQLSAFLHGEIFNPVIVFSLVLFITGLFIKTFMIPLQSVYSEFENNAAEWDLIGFELSIRILGIYAVIRLMFMIFPTLGLNQAGTFLVLLGMIIMIISSVISVFKSNFRSMLSYIMFSYIGFIFTMFGLAIYNTNYIKVLGTIAGVYSLLNLVLSFSILFLVLAYVGKADKASNKVLGTNPFYTVVFFIAAASICNLPPFGGFAAIMLLVKLLVHTKYLALLSVYMVTAVLNLIAFYRSGKLLFSEKAKKKFNIKDIRHWFYAIPVALVALIVLICGIIPHLVVNILIKPITASLYDINKYIDSVFIGGYANKMFKNKIDTPNFNAAFAGYWKEQYITTYIFATILIFIGVFYVFYRKKAMESKFTKDILDLIIKINTSTFGKAIKTVYKKLIALSFYIKQIVDDVGKANINDLVIYQIAFLAMITLFLFSVL